MSPDGEMIAALATENEQLRAELALWRAAAGWSADGFGPQTPDEVAVFQREAERVNGQVTAFEIAKLRAEVARLKKDLEFEKDCLEVAHKHGKDGREQRDKLRVDLAEASGTAKEALQELDASEAEVTYLKQQLQSYQRRSDRNRRFAFLWKEHAKRLAVSGRALERATHEAAGVLEQWNDASKQLMEQYKRDQQAHAVYRDSAEDCMRAMQTERDQTLQPMLKACDACFDECQGLVRYSTAESDHYWELAEALMELTSKRLAITMQRAPADPDDPNPGV